MDEKCETTLWIESLITTHVAESPKNNLGLSGDEKVFAQPLVGFSSGSDPLYDEYKKHIGSFYYTPLELYRQTFPESVVEKTDLTVISWILPSTTKTRQEQASQKKHPARRWIHTRAMGEDFNNTIRNHLLAHFSAKNISALSPMLSPLWSRSDQGPYAPCSNWSERHAAYAAGLGTFGLCDGLITPVGKAVRVGSVIAKLIIPPSPRPYTNHHAYCLHYSHNTCRKCIGRCPVGALSEQGHDKKICMQYTEHTMNKYIQKKFGLDTYACGLCQAGVPCMDRIPDPSAV